MKPVVLLVGQLAGVVEQTASQLEDLPIQWLAAHNREEVTHQLEVEPNIASVVIGAGLDDTIRGDLVGIIAARRPDLCIHMKDRSSGPEGMAAFARKVVEIDVIDRSHR